MGNSDLRRVRSGELSADGLGSLRAGRVLGVMGTVFSIILIALSVVAVRRLPDSLASLQGPLGQRLERFKRDMEADAKAGPLRKDQLPYAGEWVSESGNIIRIHSNGSGDYEYRKGNMTSRQTGGRVTIEDKKLSIRVFGLGSTWRIDRPPAEQDGRWTMVLDGETFVRRRVLRAPPREDDRPSGSPEYEVRRPASVPVLTA